ncbi:MULTISPECIES: hypothetical protein [Paenibacillus]|uniref:Uncharacterized protein n=1 Tax=Paenibacillus pseudetheri TaxID=2897682 RepID=A0ABN8FIM9_9BACL|nr:hypothetical protein [Paenibacillus pseudetheri]CAH1055096.1 hypothetical protein PAECIP111894_01246 [Paenibacillus pseudetheri]
MNRYVVGENVTTPDGKGKVYAYSNNWYTVKLEKHGEIKYYTELQLSKV